MLTRKILIYQETFMNQYQKLVLSGAALLPLIYAPTLFAAKPINLYHQNISLLQSIISAPPTATAVKSGVNLQEIRRSLDFKKTLHVRMQQTYLGYPVWGGDFIIHIPQGEKADKTLSSVLTAAKNNKGSMNGTLYQDLNVDLGNVPAIVFSQTQAQKALQQAIDTYQHKIGLKAEAKDQQTQLIVFIDSNNKAHWAYKVKFLVEPVREGRMPAKPVYIMDAINFKIYQQWDDIKTYETANVDGGGFGGNLKMGKLVYDGLKDNLPKLSVTRDAETETCYLKNDEVTVKNYRNRKVEKFTCKEKDSEHNDVYWDADKDSVNGGYSPDNDALFGGSVIKAMYENWYGVPVLVENDKPMMLNMVVHDPIDNAYWDGRQMTFGDGVSYFYPLTSLGVAAHEISHGFTEQHSDLAYYGQTGGMNESFSDMAAQAAEVYAYGKNSWQIGPEIFKEENAALRYMDKPSKDCEGREPGDWCSIDEVSQYHSGLDVHYSSGIYNRVFYLIGTAKGWDVRKAFEVMLQANMNYWTSTTNFSEGACGVIKSTKDLGYDVTAVKQAFETVGVKMQDDC